MEKIVAFKAIASYIKKKSLLEKVEDTGSFIKAELDRVNKKRNLFSNLRGQGTYLGFDVEDSEAALHLQTHLIRSGILVSIVGPHTIGLRPSLLLLPMHAGHLRDAMIDYNPQFHFDAIFG